MDIKTINAVIQCYIGCDMAIPPSVRKAAEEVLKKYEARCEALVKDEVVD